MAKKLFEKQLLKTGKFKHSDAPNGVLEFTRDYLQKIAENFKKSPFAPVKRGHVSNIEAEKNPSLIVSNNIKELEIKEDGLYGKLELDESEIEKYNDVSCELDPEGEDHETGEKGPYLRGVALVADPYIKGMNPFVKLSDKTSLIINLSEITNMKEDDKKAVETEKDVKEETTKKVDEEKKDENLEKESEAEVVEESKTEVTEETVEPKEEGTEVVEASEKVQARIVELEEKLRMLETENKKKDAEAKYSELLSAGKIVPAQKDAFIALSSMQSSIINLSDGKTKTTDELIADLFDKAPKVIELGEKGKETKEEINDKELKLKEDLRERHKDLSEKDYEKFWERNKTIALQAVGIG